MAKLTGTASLPWRLNWIVIINSLMMLLYHATGNGALGLAGNAFSALVVIYLLINVLTSPEILLRYGALLIFLTIALAGTLIVNAGKTDPVDFLKYISLYALFFAGTISPQRSLMSWPSAAVLLIIPLVLLPIGSRVYTGSTVLEEASFSYFQTRNAATIYFTALIFCLVPLLGWFAIPIQMLSCLLLGKIGPMLASTAAVAVWNIRPNLTSLGALIGGAVIGTIAYFIGLLQRAVDVIGPLYRDIFLLGPTVIGLMSYGEIVRRAGSTDVSGYFRIKHWVEIWQIYSQNSLDHILFGYGPGQSKLITTALLVPHNDYLRVLVEFGVFNLLCFLALLIIIIKRLPNKITKSLFTVYIVYSVTDNMIDNFSSMVLLFAGAGLYARSNVPEPDLQREEAA
jgi:O-antigen ligase